MAKKNSGKIFEEIFQVCCKKCESIYLYLHRVRDASDIGAYKTKRNVANICDFILYSHPNIFFLELKTRSTARINFNVFSEVQYNGLLLASKTRGVIAGGVLLFNNSKDCFFLDIETIEYLKEEGYKSVNVEMCEQYGIRIPLEMIRTRYKLDINTFIEEAKAWQVREKN